MDRHASGRNITSLGDRERNYEIRKQFSCFHVFQFLLQMAALFISYILQETSWLPGWLACYYKNIKRNARKLLDNDDFQSFHPSFLNLFRNSKRKKKKLITQGKIFTEFEWKMIAIRVHVLVCNISMRFNLHGEWWYTTRLIGTSMLPIKPTTIFSTKSRNVSIVFASSFSAAKPCPELVAAFSTPEKERFKRYFNIHLKLIMI